MGLSLGYEVSWACMLGAIFEKRRYVGQIQSRLTSEQAVDVGCQLL